MTLKKGFMDESQTGALPDGTQDESQEQITPGSENPGSQESEVTSETSQTGEEQGQDGATDRGTQKAKEPESQFYQTVKNENADMRALLSDPKALQEYMKRFETQASETKGEEDFADLTEKVLDENGQVDVIKLMKYSDERAQKKTEQVVQKAVADMFARMERKQEFMGELTTVYGEHPELSEKSPNYDKELNVFIGNQFIAQGGYEGKVTLKQVVDSTYAYLAKVKGTGQKQAETEIIRKRAGAIPQQKAQGESQSSEDDDLSAEDILTQRVQKAVSRK